MGTRVRHSVTLPVSAETYWDIRNSPEFMKLENEALQQSREVIEKQDDAEGRPVSAKVKTKPDMKEMPDVLTAFAPDEGVTFVDHIKYIKTSRTPYAFDAKTTPNVFSHSSNIKSRVEIIPSTDGSDTCTHSLDVIISFDGVLFVGGIIESFVADRLRKSHTRLPGIVRQYLEQTNPPVEKHVPTPAALAAASPEPTRGKRASAAEEPVVVEEDVLWVSTAGYPAWQVVLIAAACFAMGVTAGRMWKAK